MEGVYFAKSGTVHWDNMWAWLAKHPANTPYPEPTVCEHEGEVWQYMDTEWCDQTNRWVDVFRHRYHPWTNDRVYLRRGSVAPESSENSTTQEAK